MRYKEFILENTPRTLYHGTLRQFLPQILKYGLIASVGEFTRNAYHEYEDAGEELQDLVFAADKEGLNACVGAIIGALEHAGIEDTVENFFRYGAICVIYDGEDRFQHHGGGDYEDHPTQVEPGDYYTDRSTVRVDFVITGDKLRSLLRRNGIHVDRHYSDMDRGAANAVLIRYASVDYPDRRADLIQKVRSMSEAEIKHWLHQYEMRRIDPEYRMQGWRK